MKEKKCSSLDYLKIALSEIHFHKLLPQEIHFKNWYFF